MRRRMVLGAVIAVGALAMAFSSYQALQQAALQATEIQKVRGNLYVITGSEPTNRDAFSGGNTGVFVAEKGVVVVDTKLTGWGQVIVDKIRTVTDKPVVTIVNTHTHGDHTGSNEFFPPTVEVVAHENTKANMEKMDTFKGDKAKFLPTKTYKDKLSLGTGSDQIDLYYFGAGHTNGDTFVAYPALRVLQTGDMFAWKDAPLIDRNNGGSGVQFATTLSKALATIKNVDTVIPGHSPVTTWRDLEEFQRFNADLLAIAREGIKAGKSAEEAAATDLTGKYPGYKSERVRAAIQAIYDELNK